MRWLIRLSFALNAFFILAVVWIVVIRPSGPIGLAQRWLSQLSAPQIQPGDIVFLGDSLTSRADWSKLFPTLPTHNSGYPGDATDDVLKRLTRITKARPARVFLLIGTNDLTRQIPIDSIAGNVAKIIATLQSASPGTRIYVQSVLPRAADFQLRVETLNQALRAVTQAHNADWINLYPLFLDAADGSIRNDLSCDELHLTDSGYMLWQQALLGYLRQGVT